MIFIFAVVFDVASFVSEVTWNCPDVFTFHLSCDTQYFLWPPLPRIRPAVWHFILCGQSYCLSLATHYTFFIFPP